MASAYHNMADGRFGQILGPSLRLGAAETTGTYH
jgi:hypothetical protein